MTSPACSRSPLVSPRSVTSHGGTVTAPRCRRRAAVARARVRRRCCGCRVGAFDCRVGGRAVRRPRHPRRGRAAHRSRHDLQLPADQGRRPRRRREGSSHAVKALYATGFFRDVRLEAQGDVLVVAVQERPTISSITFVGNKEFDTDTIKKALKDIGIAEARIFDRSALDRAEQELKRQYITRGKYAAKVQTTVTPQERNRVAINFTIDEGDSAKIARINIVGAKAFTEKQLLSRDDADDARLAHLVHEERPVLEAEALGGPRDAAQLLPEPRLPRVQRRLDAGVDHAGQGRHLHHAQHHRGPRLHGRRTCASPAISSSRRTSSSG